MSDVTPAELREIEASHFMAIAQALVSGATNAQCEAVKNLLFWRQRELKQEMVRRFSPGEEICYLLADSKTVETGRIHHLNKMSVSIHRGAGQYEAIPIERVLGTFEERVKYLLSEADSVMRSVV
jgi:hypothetical protein